MNRKSLFLLFSFLTVFLITGCGGSGADGTTGATTSSGSTSTGSSSSGSSVVITAIAGGSSHTIALKDDGTVWQWGSLWGHTLNTKIPLQVSGLSGITGIAGGSHHGIALKSDGTVWAWGSNQFGQLGDGAVNDSKTAVQVSGLTGVTAIGGGSSNGIALKSDGTVWGWGDNLYKQIGTDLYDTCIQNSSAFIGLCSRTPVEITGFSNVNTLTNIGASSIALDKDGSVWMWGNKTKLLRVGTADAGSLAPLQLDGISGITAISDALTHSMAIKSDGTVWTWGSNVYGQLGDGTTNRRFLMNIVGQTPKMVTGLTGITSVANGIDTSIAAKSDGTVWAWGENALNQLGATTTETCGRLTKTACSTTPLQVSGIDNVKAVASGFWHSIALKNDGTVWTWGNNSSDQLGSTSSETCTDSTGIMKNVACSSKPLQVLWQ